MVQFHAPNEPSYDLHDPYRTAAYMPGEPIDRPARPSLRKRFVRWLKRNVFFKLIVGASVVGGVYWALLKLGVWFGTMIEGHGPVTAADYYIGAPAVGIFAMVLVVLAALTVYGCLAIGDSIVRRF